MAVGPALTSAPLPGVPDVTGGDMPARLRAELRTLADRLGVADGLVCRLFDELAALPLQGPFRVGNRRRFSALNRDGVPFEWSVSAGPTAGGLRFVVDHGAPGSTMVPRTRDSLAVLARVLQWIGTPVGVAATYRSTLRQLLPPDRVLDRLEMGVWIGVGLHADRGAALKVYVNQQFGDHATRYLRLASCLTGLGRPSAVHHLRSFMLCTGDKVEPGGIAVELGAGQIGRVKLYLRSFDASPAFLAAAAEAIGCGHAAERLHRFHGMVSDGTGYDPRAIIISVELPPEGHDACFKVDVNCARHFSSDQAAHDTTLGLLERLGYDNREYRAMLEVCAPHLSGDRVDRFTWLGTALREREQRINVYLHPGAA